MLKLSTFLSSLPRLVSSIISFVLVEVQGGPQGAGSFGRKEVLQMRTLALINAKGGAVKPFLVL